MTITRRMNWVAGWIAGAAVLALAGGCQDSGTPANNDAFPSARQAHREVYQFADQQAANGARQDATLRDYHFDGGKLNSLGEERLDLMLSNGDDCSPLVVYLDLPDQDSSTAARQDAVTAYLKQRGLRDDQIKLESGPNPASTTPAAPLLAQQDAQQQQPAAPLAPGAAAPSTSGGSSGK